MTQPSLLDYKPPTRAQEVDEVSVSRYHRIRDSGQLERNEREVLSALARYWIARREWPTGKELSAYMARTAPISGLLQIRPRITCLMKQFGYIEKGEVRNRERVWKLTETGQIAAGLIQNGNGNK